MAQQPTRPCLSCGIPVLVGQRFCANCGTTMEGDAYKPTELTPSSGFSFPISSMPTQFESDGGSSTTPPPPLPMSQGYQFQQSQEYQPPLASYQTPDFAKPQKDSSGRVLGQIGCGVGVIILLVLTLCGTAVYFTYGFIRSNVSNTSKSIQNSGNTSNTDITPTQSSSQTTPINALVTYASVKITIVDVRQATSFSDDTNTPDQGVVRLNFKEDTSDKPGRYYYGDCMRLLLPDGTSVSPSNYQYSLAPEASVSRKNWVDFPVSLSIHTNQLTLRIGTATEAQMNIPLTGTANLNQYQAKTVTLNKQVQYGRVNWTITNATSQWSFAGKQADKGMLYIVVDVKIDNHTSDAFRGYPGDYIRLKAGATTTTPDGNLTIPLGVEAGQTNTPGECAFLVPQGSTDYTFVLLAAPSNGADRDVSIPFQI